jgi:hypothetical protein
MSLNTNALYINEKNAIITISVFINYFYFLMEIDDNIDL